jgi:acetyl esterase/lipase
MSDVLLGVSNALVESGYVTLRFDKRSCAVYRSAWPTEPEALARHYSYDSLLSDARVALKRLAEHPDVDAKRLMIVGHSAGGLEAVMLAAELQPQCVVLLASLGRPMREVLPEQYRRALAKAPLSESVKTEVLSSLQECIRSVGETGKVPEKVHPVLAPLVNDRTKYLLRSYLNEDPTGYAKRFKGDVLVLSGALDAQVDPNKDAKRLFQAFSERKTGRSQIVILNGLSHNFKAVASIDEPGVTGPLSSDLTRELAKFVEGR